MITHNDNPNFSIVMPGGCNAECAFCYQRGDRKRKAVSDRVFVGRLGKILRTLPSQFRQISITGGEPLLSPARADVLDTIRAQRDRYRHVVLTTNGTNLTQMARYMAGVVDHVNISLHHYDERENRRVFGGTYNRDDLDLATDIDECSKVGIDVSLACVINDATTPGFIAAYLAWARQFGVAAVCFRKESGTLDPTPVERTFAGYAATESGCPACRTVSQLIGGTRVHWKTSATEPSDVLGEVYELIYNVDGKLYRDWGMRREVEIPKEPPRTSARVVPMASNAERTRYIYVPSIVGIGGGCGAPGYVSGGCGHPGGYIDTRGGGGC